MKNILLLLLAVFLFVSMLQAQFYIGPYVGFKSFGIKGASFITYQGQQYDRANTDGSKTAFNVGLSLGYQIIPEGTADNWYKLDLGIDASYSSVPFFETSFNNTNGAGSFSAAGLTGGGTKNFSFDIMPIHRLNIPKFQLLSPFAGVGLGLNLFSTSDLNVPPVGDAQAYTWTGNSEFKLGILVFYGTVIRVNDLIQPYVIFKHYIPFGSESQFTDDAKHGNAIIEDVPGYFSIAAGARFNFDTK